MQQSASFKCIKTVTNSIQPKQYFPLYSKWDTSKFQSTI